MKKLLSIIFVCFLFNLNSFADERKMSLAHQKPSSKDELLRTRRHVRLVNETDQWIFTKWNLQAHEQPKEFLIPPFGNWVQWKSQRVSQGAYYDIEYWRVLDEHNPEASKRFLGNWAVWNTYGTYSHPDHIRIQLTRPRPGFVEIDVTYEGVSAGRTLLTEDEWYGR